VFARGDMFFDGRYRPLVKPNGVDPEAAAAAAAGAAAAVAAQTT